MFGYVTIRKEELKIKEYETYKGFYCGACQALKKEYGPVGQLTLSYDMTFMVLLLSSLYEPEQTFSKERCLVHPKKKRLMIENEFSTYAAHMGILLTYYHFLDDWKDEKKPKALVGLRSFHGAFQKAKKAYPRQAAVVARSIRRLSRLEREGCMEIDKVAGLTGEILGSMYACREDIWKQTLYDVGYALGKFIYLMDAWDDLSEDEKQGNYNLLLLRKRAFYKGTPEEEARFASDCEGILMAMMAECTGAFEKLPILQDLAILENILYDGVWNRYRTKGEDHERSL